MQCQEETRRQALIAGTSPAGREVLRRILFGIEQRTSARTESLTQLVVSMQAELKRFWCWQPEFALLLSRLFRSEAQAWQQTDPRSLAVLLVLACALDNQRRIPMTAPAKK